jgi:hypothetical protein
MGLENIQRFRTKCTWPIEQTIVCKLVSSDQIKDTGVLTMVCGKSLAASQLRAPGH